MNGLSKWGLQQQKLSKNCLAGAVEERKRTIMPNLGGTTVPPDNIFMIKIQENKAEITAKKGRKEMHRLIMAFSRS